jgi:serine/threonine protein kinase
VGDLGLSRSSGGVSVNGTVHVVTRQYRAPELLQQRGARRAAYSAPLVDAWGVGCVLAELVMQASPNPNPNPSPNPNPNPKAPVDPLFKVTDAAGFAAAYARLFGPPDMQVVDRLTRTGRLSELMFGAMSDAHARESAYHDPTGELGSVLADKGLGIADLVRRMLALDPNDRPHASECLRHACFSSLDSSFQEGLSAGTGPFPAGQDNGKPDDHETQDLEKQEAREKHRDQVIEIVGNEGAGLPVSLPNQVVEMDVTPLPQECGSARNAAAQDDDTHDDDETFGDLFPFTAVQDARTKRLQEVIDATTSRLLFGCLVNPSVAAGT